MDKTAFLTELRNIFLALNKLEKRYTRVWLTEMDYGGLYYSGTYILNVITCPNTEEYSPEIKFLINLLSTKLGDEKFALINRVAVYLADEYTHFSKDDIIIYDDEANTKAA